jgi:hypothetical protein
MKPSRKETVKKNILFIIQAIRGSEQKEAFIFGLKRKIKALWDERKANGWKN